MKSRIALAAARDGKTSHAFIVEAIAETVGQSELDDELRRIADERWAHLQASSQTVAWQDARPYLEARARGEKAAKPVACKVGR